MIFRLINSHTRWSKVIIIISYMKFIDLIDLIENNPNIQTEFNRNKQFLNF